MSKRYLAALVLMLILVFPHAFAAPTPEPTTVPTVDPNAWTDSSLKFVLFQTDETKELFRMKSRLSDMHYFYSNTPEDSIKNDFFDRYTLMAIEQCCERNGLEYRENGVCVDTFNAIVSGNIVDAAATPTPAPSGAAAFRTIYPMNEGGDVTALQQQLMKLGYAFDLNTGESVVFQPGVYDEKMMTALQTYSSLKRIEGLPENQSITPELQTILLNDSEAYVPPTPAPTEAPEKVNKLVAYFTAPTTLFSIQMPTWGVWLVSIGLIVLLTLVLLYFFMPSNDKKNNGKKPSQKRGKAGKISFVIEYNGKKTEYRCDIDHTLKIGRNIGDFPIDTDDLALSGKHCEIYYSGKTLMIRDYSTNGTFVNNKPCNSGEYALHSGDTIKIGNHTLTIMF